MSNFNTFSPEHLKRLLEPFAPGMSQHVTPIKYEAITPDLFLLLFRTTGSDNIDHFFVSLEYDYISDVETAKMTIEDWHGSNLIRFWAINVKEGSDTLSLEEITCPTTGPYYALLAEVERPVGDGYWAANVVILPGDTIGEKIASYSEQQQADIREYLPKLLKHKPDLTSSVLASYEARQADAIVDDVNRTTIAVTIYARPDGSLEYFYNYTDATA